MLKVRAEQLDAFQSAADAALIRKMAKYVGERHAEDVVKIPSGIFLVKHLSDETLQQMIQTGCERARAYGLTWESSLAAFIVLMFVVAPNFDTRPAIQQILQEQTIPPNSRMDQLWRLTSEEEWDRANQNYAESAWRL